MGAWLVIPVEDVCSKCQGCFANASQFHLRLRTISLLTTASTIKIDMKSPTQYFKNFADETRTLQHTSEIGWKLTSQMSDANANVFLNHDQIQLSLLHKPHPLVWCENITEPSFQTTKSNDADSCPTVTREVLSGLCKRPNLNVDYKRFGILLFTATNG